MNKASISSMAAQLGRRGGLKTASKMTKAQFVARAKHAAAARYAKRKVAQ